LTGRRNEDILRRDTLRLSGTIMNEPQTVWIHAASFTYSHDRPDRLIETIWAERPGWGYIRRRDIWMQKECSPQELDANGFVLRKPLSDEEVRFCPYCGMYICSVPGSLVRKHLAACGGSMEDWRKLEEMVIQERRVRNFEAQLAARKQREMEEMDEEQRRERFEKIRDDMLSRQQAKDRKKRLRDETREELKRR